MPKSMRLVPVMKDGKYLGMADERQVMKNPKLEIFTGDPTVAEVKKNVEAAREAEAPETAADEVEKEDGTDTEDKPDEGAKPSDIRRKPGPKPKEK